jgi:NADH dehydrogenase [ubiquinone] 1 alpha subcomplex assembly factor 7
MTFTISNAMSENRAAKMAAAAKKPPASFSTALLASNMSALEIEIRRLIRVAGPMPVWRYMELCLSHPQYGYYTTRNPLGREGDFVTAPEVSQMFGELLGLWVASVWRQMESPKNLRLVEFGPGRGTMMADALRAMRVAPVLHQSVQVHFIEINPALRAIQQETIGDANIPVSWHNTLDDVPKGPVIILANEYFDALPIRQAVKQTTGWHERTIEVAGDGSFIYGVTPEPLPCFEALLPPVVRAAPVGAVFEWRPDEEMMRIARRIRQSRGAALIIDYGHLRSDAGETLQAIARHSYTDPLKNPGTADLTAHVDFEALGRAAASTGTRVHRPAEQGTFLRRLGIDTRAATLSAKAAPGQQDMIMKAAARLTEGGRGGMGSLFKVMGISDHSIKELPALSDESARPASQAASTPAATANDAEAPVPDSAPRDEVAATAANAPGRKLSPIAKIKARQAAAAAQPRPAS